MNPEGLAPFTEADWRQTHSTIANHNQGNALKWLLPILAVGGTAGALRGVYENSQKKQQVKKLEKDLNYPPPAMPMAPVKSASLKKTAGILDFLGGANAHGNYGPMQVPWFPAAAVASLYASHQLGKKLTKGVGDYALNKDVEEDLNKAKKKYVNSVTQPVVPPEQLKQAMEKKSDWTPSTFSLDKWGPELGLGIGALGGMSVANFLTKYHKTKMKTQAEAEAAKQKQLDAELNYMRPPLPPRISQPVAFNG